MPPPPVNASLIQLHDLRGEKPANSQQQTANGQETEIDFSGDQPSAQKNTRQEQCERENPLRVTPNAGFTPPQDTLGDGGC